MFCTHLQTCSTTQIPTLVFPINKGINRRYSHVLLPRVNGGLCPPNPPRLAAGSRPRCSLRSHTYGLGGGSYWKVVWGLAKGVTYGLAPTLSHQTWASILIYHYKTVHKGMHYSAKVPSSVGNKDAPNKDASTNATGQHGQLIVVVACIPSRLQSLFTTTYNYLRARTEY